MRKKNIIIIIIIIIIIREKEKVDKSYLKLDVKRFCWM